MINLLPEANKQALRGEQIFHLVMLLGALSVLFFVCLSLLFLSIRIYVSGEVRAQSIVVESERQKQEELPFQQLRTINTVMSSASNFYANQTIVSDIIERIAVAMPEQVYITSLNYTPPVAAQGRSQQVTNARIALTGFAPTTDDLLEFRERLEQDTLFERFVFPPSNWNTPTNITFSFDFEIQSRSQ